METECLAVKGKNVYAALWAHLSFMSHVTISRDAEQFYSTEWKRLSERPPAHKLSRDLLDNAIQELYIDRANATDLIGQNRGLETILYE